MSSLNSQQQHVASIISGPLLIVAGPGTGKTKTLVARVCQLLTHAPPEAILALTFTKKAAEEMKARVASELVGQPSPKIATFHSLCFELLAEKPTFIDEAARMALIRSLPKAAALKGATTQELSLAISLAKSQPAGELPIDQATQTLVDAYNNELTRLGLCDYDDVLHRAYAKLSSEKRHMPFRFVLVDEFQDTNVLQYQLLKKLLPNDNLCVIGDPLQSIYSFRGASSDIFTRFKTDFPHYQEVTLTTNYRSAEQVVDLANAVFPSAPKLHAHVSYQGQVQAVKVLNEYSEARWIITQIESALGGTTLLKSHEVGQGNGQGRFKDFALLYRTHQTARITERLFNESGLPYQVVGEGSPYEKPTIRAIIAAMRSLLWQAEPLPPKGFTVGQWVTQLQMLQPQSRAAPSILAAAIVKAAGIEITPDVRQFMNSLIRFDNAGGEAFLQHVDSIAEQVFYDPEAEAVTLTTIHAAKGLEFRRVFLIGAEKGILPHKRVANQKSGIDEERRLFYVAVTRAKETLTILYTKTRSGQPSQPSSFIQEVPAAILPRVIDPSLELEAVKQQKRRQKRAQTSLL